MSAGCGASRPQAIRNLEQSLAEDHPRSLIQMATGSGKTFTAANALLPADQARGRQADLVPGGPVEPGQAGQAGVRQVHHPRDPAQVPRRVQRPAPDAQHPRRHLAGVHLHRPADLLDPQGRGGAGPGDRRAFGLRAAGRRAGRGQLQPGPAARHVRRHHHRRVPPLHLRAVAAGAGVLRRAPDRADRHPDQADLRVLPPEPGDGVLPRRWRSPTASTSTSPSTRSRPRSPRAGPPSRPGEFAGYRDRQTRKVRWEAVDEPVEYTAAQLDRAVVAEDQIRTVIQTFKDKLFTELFPGRKTVPKTLIFAKDDSHADDIVQIVREVFGKGNQFATKITYRPRTVRPRTCSRRSGTRCTPGSWSPWT